MGIRSGLYPDSLFLPPRDSVKDDPAALARREKAFAIEALDEARWNHRPAPQAKPMVMGAMPLRMPASRPETPQVGPIAVSVVHRRRVAPRRARVARRRGARVAPLELTLRELEDLLESLAAELIQLRAFRARVERVLKGGLS